MTDGTTAVTKNPQPEVVLYGALRSGTTVLRLMLRENEQINCPGEADFLFDYMTAQKDDGPELDFNRLFRERVFKIVIPEYATIPKNKEAMNAMVTSLTNRPHRVGAKTVLIHHRSLPQLLKQFPDAKIIHVIRDPRDVARSSVGMGWAGSTYYGINHWEKTESDWAKYGRDLPAERVMTVRYEELIVEPELWLHRMCDFIGVPYQDAMLEYDQTTTYKKPDPSLIFQWKHKQTPMEIGLVEGRVGPLMAELGYEPSGQDPVIPGVVMRARLALQQKTATWRRRIQDFGLIDSVLLATARRTGWHFIARGAEDRIELKIRRMIQ